MSRRRTFIEVTATALIAFVSSLIALGPAVAALGVPWGRSDMTYSYWAVRYQGWPLEGFSRDFAYPDGAAASVYAGLDVLPNAIAHAMSALSGNPFLGLNLLLVLSFPIVAIMAYAAIRMTGLAGPIAIALANAYTFIPFHFGRGIGHVYLALLFGMVAGMLLTLLVGSGRWWEWLTQGPKQRRIGRVVLVLGLVLVAAWSGLYYAVFSALLLVSALIWRISRGDGWRKLGAAVLPLVALGMVALIGLIPVLMSRIHTPGAASVGLRDPMDSVALAGNLAVSWFPQPYSQWLTAYNDVVNRIFQMPIAEEGRLMSNFGTVVTTAALVMFVIGLVLHFRRRSQGTPDTNESGAHGPWELDRHSRVDLPFVAYLLAVQVLLFVPWGLNFLFANFVTAQIRAWNRLVVVLLLLFILGAAAALVRWSFSRRPTWSIPIAAVIIALTVVEAIWPWRGLYQWAADDGRTRADSAWAYATAVERAIPKDCGVLTLPFVAYPNAGPTLAMDDYDHYLLTLTNPHKSVSYGALRGSTTEKWLQQFTADLTAQQAYELRGRGFCGVHVDTAGYDNPKAVEQSLGAALGAPVATSPDGRWVMFALQKAGSS